MRKISVRAILVMLIFSLPGVAGGQEPPAGPPGAPVTVVSIAGSTVRATIEVIGTVLPATESKICTEVAGLVQHMPVKQGQRVKKGQILCKLNDTAVRLSGQEAQATLEALKQQLAELTAGSRKEDIERLQANHEEAKAVKDKWQREKARLDDLYEKQVASSKEYLDTMADYTAAAQRLAAAKAALDKAVAGPRKEQIARARARVVAQQAVADQIQDRLEKTSIPAPFDGYVTAKRTELGQWLQVGGVVADMIDLQTVLIRVDVPENAIIFVKAGDPAEAQIDALGMTVSGKVVHIIPSGDRAGRTFPVEIEVANESGKLKAGMFARAKLPAGAVIQALTVPKDAIVRRGPMRMVYVVRMNTAIAVPIETGLEHTDRVAVFGQLQTGDLVVVRGNESLRPGQNVIPIGLDGKPFIAKPSAPPATQPANDNQTDRSGGK